MCVRIDLKLGQLADADRLNRRPDPIVPALIHAEPMVLGDQPADRHTTLAPHARPHAAAGKRLALVRTAATQSRYSPNFPSCHFLTPANDGVIVRRQLKFLRWGVNLLETTPKQAILSIA